MMGGKKQTPAHYLLGGNVYPFPINVRNVILVVRRWQWDNVKVHWLIIPLCFASRMRRWPQAEQIMFSCWFDEMACWDWSENCGICVVLHFISRTLWPSLSELLLDFSLFCCTCLTNPPPRSSILKAGRMRTAARLDSLTHWVPGFFLLKTAMELCFCRACPLCTKANSTALQKCVWTIVLVL